MPGDKICVLAGGKLPFILRPLEPNTSRFKLVSECFVKGIMDGEAMTDPRWSYSSRKEKETMPSEYKVDSGAQVKWQQIILI